MEKNGQAEIEVKCRVMCKVLSALKGVMTRRLLDLETTREL